MSIRMRENQKKESKCENCGTKYINTREMIDIKISGHQHTLCYKCYDELFTKLLRMQCAYQAKLKSKEDIERIQRESKIEKK